MYTVWQKSILTVEKRPSNKVLIVVHEDNEQMSHVIFSETPSTSLPKKLSPGSSYQHRRGKIDVWQRGYCMK